jgi:two-component system chemotaxis sensor kinase CheA
MAIDMSQFYQVFFEETAEHLAAMENLLLALDVAAPDPDDLNAIFRAAHSIKGGSGTFGFTDMTEVTHILETLLDQLRKGERQLRPDMVDAFLQAGDVLKSQLEGHQSGAEVDQQAVKDVCHVLEQLSTETDSGVVPQQAAEQSAGEAGSAYRIVFQRDPAVFTDASRLDGLLEELAQFGPLTRQDSGDDAEVTVQLVTAAAKEQILDVFGFLLQPEQVLIEPVAAAQSDDDSGFGFFVDPQELKAQSEDEQGFGFFEDIPAPAAAQAAPTTNPEPAKTAASAAPAKAATQSDASSIRVGTDKVDQLINLVGELVITQAMLAQTADGVDPVIYENLLNGMAQLERNTRDLQEAVMSIRMMPINFVFSRFPRVVRDLAGKLNKQVELKTVGEGTELDKGLIEKISDPLTHLVRNSLDHGIELPEKRLAAGKDAKGTITLRASHQGGNIVIEVADDGAGLNRDKILAKAKERGLAVSDAMTNHEVFNLIFAPGFSTAEVVTDVSGRGVGMDVVKRNIEGMGGRVEIDSELGAGTRITIRLPLTLAILDGMSIAVGGDIFILPLSFIIESMQPPKEDVKTVAGQGQVVHVRGEYLPLIALHQLFNIQPKVTEAHQGILVIIESDGNKMALFVDELVGQHQVVIKSLESNYRKVPCVSGATIMGDGKVALILDVTSLARLSQGHNGGVERAFSH